MGLLLLSLAGAVAPAAFLLHFVYVRDKYEREPLRLVLRVYFISFLTVLPAAILEFIGQAQLNAADQNELVQAALLAFFIVGFAEEGTKFIFLRWLAFKHAEFDEVYDGVLYAVAVSLGFATVENVMYVFAYSELGLRLGVIVFRALLAVPLHALLGVLMGYYVGRAKFAPDPSSRSRFLWLALVLPALLHGLYDFPLFGLETGVGTGLKVLFVLTVLATSVTMWVIGARIIGSAQRQSPFKRPNPLLHPIAALNPAYKFCTQCGSRAGRAELFCQSCGAPWATPAS